MSTFTPINGPQPEDIGDPMEEAEANYATPHASDSGGEDDVAEPAEEGLSPPKSPKKKTAKATGAKPTTPRKRKSTAAKDDEEGSPKKKLTPAKFNGNMQEEGATKKTKARGKGHTVKARPIPTSIEAASPVDKALLRMRDEKADWGTIVEFWKNATGEDILKGTLAKRYSRLKQNVQVWNKEDEERLLKVKKDVEDGLELQKWQKIQKDFCGEDNEGKFTIEALQRKFKQVSTNNPEAVAAVAAAGPSSNPKAPKVPKTPKMPKSVKSPKTSGKGKGKAAVTATTVATVEDEEEAEVISEEEEAKSEEEEEGISEDEPEDS